jgi:hypothetical protein
LYERVLSGAIPDQVMMSMWCVDVRAGVDEIPSAYDMIYSREKEMLGVVFQWDAAADLAPRL